MKIKIIDNGNCQDFTSGQVYKVVGDFGDYWDILDDVGGTYTVYKENDSDGIVAVEITESSQGTCPDPMPIVEPEEDLMETTESSFSLDYQIKSDGGPSSYYDFPSGKDAWVTLNDMNDYKSVHQWGPLSFHMTNVNKATFRFGQKDGTSKVYDINKIIYSGLRMKLMLEDKEAVRKYLQQLLDDPQFQEGTE